MENRIEFTEEMRKTHTILIPNMLPVHFELIANVLVQQGSTLPDEKTVEEALASFKDAEEIPAERRAAVVLCMQKGLIKGYTDGTFQPQRGFTRAEFAKLLTLI